LLGFTRTAMFDGGSMGFSRGALIPRHDSSLIMITRLIDIFLVGVSLWLLADIFGVHWSNYYSEAVGWTIALFVFFGEFHDIYRYWHGARFRQEVAQILMTWTGVVLLLMFVAYLRQNLDDYSRTVMLTWFVIAPGLLLIWRGGVQFGLRMIRRQGINTRRVAIVGARDLGAKLVETMISTPWLGLRPAGFYDDRKAIGNRRLPGNIAGNFDDLVQHARQGKIELIYIALPMFAEERIKSLIAELSDTTATVYLVPDVFMYELLNARWGNVGGFPVVSIFDTPFYGVDGWLKRVLDVVLASAILLVLLIPMIVIAIGVKFSSPGPIIFRQRRYGINGETIDVWKFRTMTVCENDSDVRQATKSDTRVTRFGRFLRQYSLDELPQFINVLQGQMSVVGPRPHAVIHNEQYRKLINGYMLRHKVKPGITGLAQINGWRGETDTLDKMQRRIEFDLGYINEWSVALDLKIIALTVFRGFRNKNAY